MSKNNVFLCWLFILLVVSLLAHLALLDQAIKQNDTAVFFSGDTESYLLSARALLATSLFMVSPDNPYPQIIRTPGYPLFLAAIFGLVGENWSIVIIFQSIISVATIGLTYLIGTRLWNSRVGFIAAIWLALDLNSLAFSMLALTETLFTFFLITFILFFVRLIHSEGEANVNRLSFAAGLFLAVATHIRPVSYYLVFPVLVGWLAWSLWQRWDYLSLMRSTLFFIFPLLFLLGGWQVRNFLITGESVFSAIESINMVNYRAAMVIAEREGGSRDDGMAWIRQEYKLDTAPGWTKRWGNAGINIILDNPGIFFRQYMRGLGNIFLGPGSERIGRLMGVVINITSPLGDLFRLSPGEYLQRWVRPYPGYFLLFVFSLVHMFMLYVFSLWGLLRVPKILPTWFLVGVLFYLALISAGPEAYSRFRVPITPILALFASVGLDDFTFKKD